MTEQPISLLAWSGRAFELDTSDAFAKWIATPFAIAHNPDYKPAGKEIPPRLRGKCSTLSRLVIDPFFDVIAQCQLNPATVDLVFASQFGEIRVLETLLESIYRHEALSPLDFCNSVHHTATGYAAIAAKNQQISKTVSAGMHTFGAGLIECWTLLRTGRSTHVVLLTGDESVPSFFLPDEEPGVSMGIAMVFSIEANPATVDDGRCSIPVSMDEVLRVYTDAMPPVTWLRTLKNSGAPQ